MSVAETLEMMAQIREVFEQFRRFDEATQNGACALLVDRTGVKEAGAKLWEMFEADRAVERPAPKPKPAAAKAPEAAAKAPEVEKPKEPAKSGAVVLLIGGRRWRQLADGSWAHSDGGMWRRHLGAPPKEALASLTPKPKQSQAGPEGVVTALKPMEQAKPKPETEPEPETEPRPERGMERHPRQRSPT
jgi:hypothetical protein